MQVGGVEEGRGGEVGDGAVEGDRGFPVLVVGV